MRFPGSKRRLAGKISSIIEERRGIRNTYVEPFLGGANSLAIIAPNFARSFAIEANLDLALMWQAVKGGWAPPEFVTEAEYAFLKKSSDPSPLRGFVGVGGSFGGKWWGGYARGGLTSVGNPRNHQAESARAVLKKFSALENTSIMFGNYSDAPVTADCVVYCDPPYAETLSYSGAQFAFDSRMFWRQAESWASLGALVLVSEYTAPNSWIPILEVAHVQSVSAVADRKETTERLFVHKSFQNAG